MTSSPHSSELKAESPPVCHAELAHTTIQLLREFYPEHASPEVSPAQPSEDTKCVKDAESAACGNTSSSCCAAGDDKDGMVVVVQAALDGDDIVSPSMCTIISSPHIALPQFPQLELPFLSIAAQERRHAGQITSDDADEHTPLTRLVVLLLRLAGPVAVTQMLRGSMALITAVFMGQYLSTKEFAAATTGLTFTNLTAMSIGAGFSAALDTLATQEHGRLRHSPEIANILLRSMICSFTVYVPIAVSNFFCAPVLRALIHADLVDDTAYFLRMSVFIATPMILVNNLLKFAQAQKVTQLGVIASVAGAATLPLCLLIFRNGGLRGIITALSLNRFFTLSVVLGGILRNRGLRQCWVGHSVWHRLRVVLSDYRAMRHFIAVGLPVLGANCADSWSFEILGIMAAHLSPTSAAIWGVVMVIYGQLFAVYVGVASASAIRIGNSMGSGKGLLARRYSYATVLLILCITTVFLTLLWTSSGALFRLIQRDPVVASEGEKLKFFVGLTFFFDSFFYSMQGPFRGAGYNSVLLLIIVIGMWGVAVPLAFFLSIVLSFDVRGLIWGLGVGVVATFPLQLSFLWCFLPWEKQAVIASRR